MPEYNPGLLPIPSKRDRVTESHAERQAACSLLSGAQHNQSGPPPTVDVSRYWDGARRGRVVAQAPRSYPAGVIKCKIQERLLCKTRDESQLSEAE